MPDPQMDEGFLLSALNVPAGLGVVDRLQTAAMMAIVDGYDRKILRDPFVSLTASGLSLHTNLGRLHIIARIIELEKTQKLTKDRLDEAHIQLMAFCETERIGLVKQVELVTSCPTSSDKVS